MQLVILLLIGAMVGVFVTALANAASCRDCELRIREEKDDIEEM